MNTPNLVIDGITHRAFPTPIIGKPKSTTYQIFGKPYIGAIIKAPIADNVRPAASRNVWFTFLLRAGTKLMEKMYEIGIMAIRYDDSSAFNPYKDI